MTRAKRSLLVALALAWSVRWLSTDTDLTEFLTKDLSPYQASQAKIVAVPALLACEAPRPKMVCTASRLLFGVFFPSEPAAE